MGEMTEREQYVLQAAIQLAGRAGRSTTTAVCLTVDKIRPTLLLAVHEVRAILLRLADRGLLRMEKVGRTYQATAPTLDERHQQAIDEDRERFPARRGRSCCTSTEGDAHTRECGTVEARKQWAPAGSAHGPVDDREVNPREERRQPRVETVHIGGGRTVEETKTTPQRSLLQRATPGFRGGKIPPGWTPENSAKIASEIRSAVLTASAMAVPGQMSEAADLVGRVVKRAQYDALRAVLAEINATSGDPYAQFDSDDFRAMLNDAARKLGCRLPVTADD